MNFETGHLYHVYNQGNNRQKIFFKQENYLFFLQKIKTHILPFADVLAFCLMPNHFHLLVHVHSVVYISRSATLSCVSTNIPTTQSLNQSIGIMLASYTRAIHKQEDFSGSLFRQKTKAICLTKNDDITPSYFNTAFGTLININTPENQYPKICFDYIHNNPLKAGLVKNSKDWAFSSLAEYNGKEKHGIINADKAKEYGFI